MMQDDNRLNIENNKVLVTEPGMYIGYLSVEAEKKVPNYNMMNPLGKILSFPRKVEVRRGGADTAMLGYTYGPGWQYVLTTTKEWLYTDGDPVEVIKQIRAEVKEKTGQPGSIELV